MNTILEENYPYMTPDDWEMYYSTNIQHFHLPDWFGLQPTAMVIERLERLCHFCNDLTVQHLTSPLPVLYHLISLLSVDIASRGEYSVQIADMIVRVRNQM
jgi:hypothetical protein